MTPRRSKRTRGQAIVLMAFTAAFLAFTVLTTFAIGKAVRERIQIQNAADASAYSLAVEEARAFNFYAYTNRAIVAHFVAMMAVYGHMSYLVYYDSMLGVLADQWGCTSCMDSNGDWATSIQAQEIYITAAWCIAAAASLGMCGFCDEMCANGGICLATDIPDINNDLCKTLCDDKSNIDNDTGYNNGSPQESSCFKDLAGIAGLHRTGGTVGGVSVPLGYVGQLKLMEEAVDAEVQDAMLGAITSPSMTQQIASQFDPNYKTGITAVSGRGSAVGLLNIKGIPGDSNNAGYCMIDGTSAGPVTSAACKALGGNGDTSLSTQQQAANASRYGPGLVGDWLRDRPDGASNPLFDVALAMLVDKLNIPYWVSTLDTGDGMSREVTDPISNPVGTVQAGDLSQGGCSTTGKNCGSGGGGSRGFAAEDHGNLDSVDWACLMPSGGLTGGFRRDSIQTFVFSEPKPSSKNGGEYSEIGWTDTTWKDTGEAYDIGGCNTNVASQCGVGVATINYNPDSSPDTLFNQPHTWAVVTKSFSDSDLTTPPSNYSSTQSEGGFAMKRNLSFDNGKNNYTYNNGITLQKGDTDYSPGREAMYAIASGLAYYHRPGNWKEPPNFYNPYWRAKLEPIMQKAGATKSAGADVAALMIAGGYPPTQAAELGAAIAAGTFPVTE